MLLMAVCPGKVHEHTCVISFPVGACWWLLVYMIWAESC